MLILRRKSGESIVISDNIVLTVLDINEGSVRLAIDAPKEIPILRSELLQAADANRDSAAAGQTQPHGIFQLLNGKQGAARPVRPGTLRKGASARENAPTDSGAPANGPGVPAPADTPTDSGAPAQS